MGHTIHYDSFHHLIWKRCPNSVFVGRKRLDVASDAAIVYNEGETGRVPIFSIPVLSVCTFMKLGVVEIDRNESQTLKSKLLKLASPQEKKKQVAQAATWVGYDRYEAGYISDARFKPCVVLYMSRFWAISVLNNNIILKTVVWVLF